MIVGRALVAGALGMKLNLCLGHHLAHGEGEPCIVARRGAKAPGGIEQPHNVSQVVIGAMALGPLER